jgi:hypothetical protein
MFPVVSGLWLFREWALRFNQSRLHLAIRVSTDDVLDGFRRLGLS